MTKNIIRLFIDEEKLHQNLHIKITDKDFQYLNNVMRLKKGDEILVFNGKDGDFKAEIFETNKKFLNLEIKEKVRNLEILQNITLAFSLIKNVRIDFIAQKATELGVTKFQPILTDHTIVNKINLERFKANIKEATEQCGRNDFPEIFELTKLEKLIKAEEFIDKIIVFCDESLSENKENKASKILPIIAAQNKEIVILIGPEGGFSAREFEYLRKLKNIYAINLGKRILRADTAIISAITLVQEFL